MRATNPHPELDPKTSEAVGQAMGRLPSGLFVLTAAQDDSRMGIIVSFVQQACLVPPMVMVAIAKGRPIMPLISESRQFGLCQLAENDRMMVRKFAKFNDAAVTEDPFLGFELLQGVLTKLPILANTLTYLECELVSHMDIEGDHDLFVGAVRGGELRQQKVQPHIRLRETGQGY
jgi:flavin reductase (DIM6/NTAB) family NADH-FMN oxidoreductase RutF